MSSGSVAENLLIIGFFRFRHNNRHNKMRVTLCILNGTIGIKLKIILKESLNIENVKKK